MFKNGMFIVAGFIIVFKVFSLATANTITSTEINRQQVESTNLNEPVKSSKYTMAEYKCMAKNMYYEARGEDLLGKALVLTVTLNRASNRNVCNAVYQKDQFSWTREKQRKMPQREMVAYTNIAKAVIDEKINIPTEFKKATHYYNPYVISKPYWANNLEVVGQHSNHVFLK